jgi:hypothetical protein
MRPHYTLTLQKCQVRHAVLCRRKENLRQTCRGCGNVPVVDSSLCR